MINGQALGDHAKLKYGLFSMSYNGCEVISVCNALEYLGKNVTLDEVRRYMLRFCVLLGLFGSNVYRIGKALKHFGVKYSYGKSAENAKAFIISSWKGKTFRSSIHTVFCVRENGKIKVYNRYNSCPHEKYYSSEKEIFDGCRVLAVYEFMR